MDESLQSWQQNQGYIVTGGGQVVLFSESGKDFSDSDLPHYLLHHNQSHETFRAWLKANRRSSSVIGCWSRPIFAGGWRESSFHDTSAYNLQTPSLFIDMRFPTKQPSTRIQSLGSLCACSIADLRVLAQQHCFAGYSLPDTPRQNGPIQLNSDKHPTFTRHHIIDWNLHPLFPRKRPNCWWVEVSDETNDGDGSFKEHSSVRNPATGLPVYFERWARIPPFPKQKTKYFAARKLGGRDAVIIIVGDHFALAIDRPAVDMSLLDPVHVKKHCGGGGAMFVDYLLCHSPLETSQAMTAARDYLDLEGSYGLVQPAWIIQQSTHPWLEKAHLISVMDTVSFIPDGRSSTGIQAMHWSSNTRDGSRPHCYGAWEVLECSFTIEELNSMFQPSEESIASCQYQFRSKL